MKVSEAGIRRMTTDAGRLLSHWWPLVLHRSLRHGVSLAAAICGIHAGLRKAATSESGYKCPFGPPRATSVLPPIADIWCPNFTEFSENEAAQEIRPSANQDYRASIYDRYY